MASVTQHLIFDPTDADSLASSHNVGAFVRAGTDGDLIGSETLNALEWLRVTGPIIDSSGNEVGVTNNALDVNVGAEHDEDSAHTSGDSGSFSLAIRVDDLTAVPATALADTELDYQGLIGDTDGALFTAAKTLDGSGNPINSTTGSLDVNITNATDIDVDDDLADTAIENATTNVSAGTAVAVVTSALANRKWLWLANHSKKAMFWGKPGVTAANGFPLYPGMQHVARIGASVAPEAIGRVGALNEDLRVMELS